MKILSKEQIAEAKYLTIHDEPCYREYSPEEKRHIEDVSIAQVQLAQDERVVAELFQEIEEMLTGVLNTKSDEWLELKARYLAEQIKGKKEDK